MCICISFSVCLDPSVLTNSCSYSDFLPVASSRHCEYFRFRSRACSAHPAGLRSTHRVFLRSLLVGVSFRSCWHQFPSIRSFCVGSWSTQCVFLHSLLVGVSFRSCWHRFPFIRSFCVISCSIVCLAVFLAVSRSTVSCTPTLFLTAHSHIRRCHSHTLVYSFSGFSCTYIRSVSFIDFLPHNIIVFQSSTASNHHHHFLCIFDKNRPNKHT